MGSGGKLGVALVVGLSAVEAGAIRGCADEAVVEVAEEGLGAAGRQARLPRGGSLGRMFAR